MTSRSCLLSGSRMSTRVRALNKQLKQDHLPNSGVAPQLWSPPQAMRYRSGEADAAGTESPATSSQAHNGGSRQKIDKSLLTISEPKRHRSKEHLQYVAQQPCLICGRSPSHAHHIRFAQSKGLALKVSDEFTVPLCAIHHSENHSTGDERKWWQKHNIEPLAIARRLWEESCKRGEIVLPTKGIPVSPPIDLKLLNVEFAARIPISTVRSADRLTAVSR